MKYLVLVKSGPVPTPAEYKAAGALGNTIALADFEFGADEYVPRMAAIEGTIIETGVPTFLAVHETLPSVRENIVVDIDKNDPTMVHIGFGLGPLIAVITLKPQPEQLAGKRLRMANMLVSNAILAARAKKLVPDPDQIDRLGAELEKMNPTE
jgi:hypothetical protein